nr:DUF1799 domain-containing protein [Massilia sp. YIM B02443]
MTLEDLAADPVEIWPENLQAYELFCAMDTQWRIGMAGPTGLDYAALPMALRMIGAARSDWQQLMADIRVMESAALQAMRSKD